MSPLEDVSLGELARSLELLRKTMTDEVRALRAEIRTMTATFVPLARYDAEQNNLRGDIAELRAASKDAKERSERMRLAVFTAIIAPLLVTVIAAVVMVRGVG